MTGVTPRRPPRFRTAPSAGDDQRAPHAEWMHGAVEAVRLPGRHVLCPVDPGLTGADGGAPEQRALTHRVARGGTRRRPRPVEIRTQRRRTVAPHGGAWSGGGAGAPE